MDTDISVRVVNVRADDDDFRAQSDEKVYHLDRNHFMGNPHFKRNISFKERERVVMQYDEDLMKDMAQKGPKYQFIMKVAEEMVLNNQKVALQCFCAPKPCHLDSVAREIQKKVNELVEQNSVNIKKDIKEDQKMKFSLK